MSLLGVLLVDVNPTFRRSAVQFLREHCMDTLIVVGAASECDHALALAAALRPQVVLFGLQVVVHPDLQQIQNLRRLLPKSGIIALGVLDIDGYWQIIRAAGADGFITKDSLKESLLPTIEQVMRAYR